jgi:predicted RNA-binding Zn-ribbon protein involved in translation (DUF1610 family)
MVSIPITKAINDEEKDVACLKKKYVLYQCPKCQQEIMVTKEVLPLEA